MNTAQRRSINTFSEEAIGTELTSLAGGLTPGGGAYPAINDALFVPFISRQSILVTRLFCINGATASGNVDVGIYSETGTRIVSSGSTAQSGTSVAQFFNVTDTPLGPGRYYMAVAMDTIGGTLFRANSTVVVLQMAGVAKQATAFPLPATATIATVTSGFLPAIGLELGALL